MNFTELLQNKQQFTQAVKDELSKRAFNQLELMKREMSNDFLKQEQEQD